jgi:hypothetical protein
VACGNGTYTFDAAGDACYACPEYSSSCYEDKIMIREGFWRIAPGTTTMMECPYGSNACQGGSSYGDASCTGNFEGPLCGYCVDGYYFQSSDTTCQSCEGKDGKTQLIILIVVPLCLLIALTLAVFYMLVYTDLANSPRLVSFLMTVKAIFMMDDNNGDGGDGGDGGGGDGDDGQNGNGTTPAGRNSVTGDGGGGDGKNDDEDEDDGSGPDVDAITGGAFNVALMSSTAMTGAAGTAATMHADSITRKQREREQDLPATRNVPSANPYGSSSFKDCPAKDIEAGQNSSLVPADQDEDGHRPRRKRVESALGGFASLYRWATVWFMCLLNVSVIFPHIKIAALMTKAKILITVFQVWLGYFSLTTFPDKTNNQTLW